jgi:hypothetical protein
MSDNLTCSTFIIRVRDDIIDINKCEWYDRKMNNCRFNKINDTLYCKAHQYVIGYTKEEKNKSKLCKGCKRVLYLDGFKTCFDCRKRNKKKHTYDKCNKDGCNYKKSVKSKYNDYCGKHQRYAWKLDIEARKLKVCRGYLRGCTHTLPIDYKFSSCLSCREKENKNENPIRIHRKSSKNRKIYSNLTDEQIIDLSKKLCHYCNLMDKRGWNGIDRLNNQKPYILSNVVSCCKTCNYMKQKLEYNRFINACTLISKHYPIYQLGQIPTDKIIKNKIDSINYKIKKKNLTREMLLTFDQVKDILSYKCRYCGNHNSNKIGMDRIDPNKGYIIKNVVPCCKICNFIKWTLPLDNFISQCKKIANNFKM